MSNCRAGLINLISRAPQAHGVVFSSLLCLNNMPIKRFADWLLRRGKMEEYMQLLAGGFNPAAGAGLMCRDTVSVAWDGRLYDCDFNQQLAIPMALANSNGNGNGNGNANGSSSGGAGPSVFDVTSLDELTGRRIAVDNHCFGCTAGSGSSCQGATS